MSKFVYQNEELLHYDQLVKGTAIILTNKEGIRYEKKRLIPQEGGIYSDVMGKLVDDSATIEEYSCSPTCPNPMVGRIYEGQVCPYCGCVVKNNFGYDIEKNGWINLDTYKVMLPSAYSKIYHLIGNKELPNIISFDNNIDMQGNIIIGTKIADKKHPFSHIGMIEFYRRFEEIISYYGKLKRKPQEAEFLIKNKNRIWTSKIPVLSQHLRPAFINSAEKVMRYDGLNGIYSTIINNASLIAKANLTNQYDNINKYLETIQSQLFDFYNQIVTKLNGKTKLYRRKIQGSRMSWSSRMVITANTGMTYAPDHITISYKAFFELYFYEIINCLKKGIVTTAFVDKTIYEIVEFLDVMKYSSEVHETIYQVMKWLIDNNEDGLWCLINRPPTMDIGSMQFLRIVDVTPNAIETNMRVPLTSLVGWNGDFDGDTLSTYSVKEKCLIDEFQEFNPRNLIVNKTSGYQIYNDKFGVPKDMIAFLYAFLPENSADVA